MDLNESFERLDQDLRTLLSAPVGSKRIKITDLTPRDGQQCKLATRVSTDDLLPLCAALDKCGFYAVEVWGGASFDASLRYLKEDPWERLKRIKEVMPNTKLQMLLRGQHILAYKTISGPNRPQVRREGGEERHYRLPGVRGHQRLPERRGGRQGGQGVRGRGPRGGELHHQPVHTLEKWMEYAEQVLEIGADWLSLKDATGIIMPFDAYRIIKGMKDRAKELPVLLHTHDMTGASSMCHVMALLAGVDMIDTVLSPLAFGSSHPATETMIAALKDTPFDTGIDLKLLEEPTRITRDIGEKYSEYATKYGGVNAEVLKHKMPGGMISNMVAQLKEAGRMDLMEAALKEVRV